ncbi:MAG: hypothetical protein RR817_06660, partial [Niameybacter sp.]
MEVIVEVIFDLMLVMMLLSLFNLIRYTIKIRKVKKMHKDNPNIRGISIVNGEIKVIENMPNTEQIAEEKSKD